MTRPVIHNRDHRRGGADAMNGRWYFVGDADASDFESPWANTGGGAAVLRYGKNDDELVIHGDVTGGTLPSVLFILPASHWPEETSVKANAVTVDGELAAVTVSHVDGSVTLSAVDAGGAAAVASDLAAHIADTSDAHDASAISIADAGSDFTATTVEGALDELQADHETDAAGLAAHLADTTAAHAASAISVNSATLVGTGTDAQAVFEEIDNAIVAAETATANHLADTTNAHPASAIGFTPAGSISATTVQAAIEEVASEGGGAPNAEDVPVTPFGTIAATDVQAALEEIVTEGGGGSGPFVGIGEYEFDTATTDNPGAGQLRVNQADIGDVDHVYIDYFTSSGYDIGAAWLFFDTGSAIEGVLIVRSMVDPINKWAIWRCNGIANDAGDEFIDLNVEYLQNSQPGGAGLPWADGEMLSATFIPTALTLDADLVAIAAIAPTNDDFIQRKGGAWTNRTVAQVQADLGSGGGVAAPGFRTGQTWFYFPSGGTVTGAPALDVMTAIPVYLPAELPIDRLLCDTTGNGGAGSVIRLGMYDNDDGVPGALIVDGGTFAAASGNGPGKPVTVSVTVAADGWYWLVYVAQVHATVPSVRCLESPGAFAAPFLWTSLTTAPGAAEFLGYSKAAVSGALPDPFGTPAVYTGNPARVYIRVT